MSNNTTHEAPENNVETFETGVLLTDEQAAAVFTDPVGYLQGLGITSELIPVGIHPLAPAA